MAAPVNFSLSFGHFFMRGLVSWFGPHSSPEWPLPPDREETGRHPDFFAVILMLPDTHMDVEAPAFEGRESFLSDEFADVALPRRVIAGDPPELVADDVVSRVGQPQPDSLAVLPADLPL